MNDLSQTLNHSLLRTHDFERLELEGAIPEELSGTLYRAGPGLLERFGRAVTHPFDADGAVSAVRLEHGQALGASKVISSPEFLKEEEAGKFLYGSSAPWLTQVKNALQKREKCTGNTNVLSWQGRLYALMEGSKAIELDAETLQTRRPADFGVVGGWFSAHPHRVESLKTTFNFGMRGPHLDLFALPDAGAARQIGTVTLDKSSMVHDFIATERHLVFVVGPAHLVTWRAITRIGSFSDYFKWEPEDGTTVVVVPLARPEARVHFAVEAFWVWHFVNAFEDGQDIVVDVCRHEDFSAFYAPSSVSPGLAEPTLSRLTLSPTGKRLRTERLWDKPVEFPSVHPRTTGARQRYTWLQIFLDRGQAGGVARFDHETGTPVIWRAPSGDLGVEPIFVPRLAEGESSGWVLQLFKDPRRQQSYLAILDAERLEEGPIAKAWFGQQLPMTFHGAFVAR